MKNKYQVVPQAAATKKPPKALDRSASIYLDMLLKSLGPSERPVVLILKRFHKVLDNLDKWMQGWRRSTVETYVQRGY